MQPLTAEIARLIEPQEAAPNLLDSIIEATEEKRREERKPKPPAAVFTGFTGIDWAPVQFDQSDVMRGRRTERERGRFICTCGSDRCPEGPFTRWKPE